MENEHEKALLRLIEPHIKQDVVCANGNVCLALRGEDGEVVAVKIEEPDTLLELSCQLRLLCTRMQDKRLGEGDDNNE